jgi:hypothetical protein
MKKVEQIKSLSVVVVLVMGCLSLEPGDTSSSMSQEAKDHADEDYPIDTEEIMEETEEMEEEFLTEDLFPIWTAPEQYRQEIRLSWGKQSLTVKRFVSGKRIRSEILDKQRQTVWLEPTDPLGSAYQIVEGESLAIVLPPGNSEYVFTSRQLGAGIEGYPIEYLGEDTISGKQTLEYRITSAEGVVFAWFDLQSGAPLRMETEHNGVPYIIVWKNLHIKAQPDDLFEVPESFAAGKHEFSATPEDDRFSKAIVGQLSEEEAARIDGGSPDPVWQQVFHASAEETARAHGHPFGGLLGPVAGEYVPGWMGAVLAGKTGEQK